MILGILSDSHGRADRVERAVRLLTEKGAEAFVHCGDVGGDAVIDALAGTRACFVWGNTDLPDPALAQYAAALGLTPPAGVPTWISAEGKAIAVFHGHERVFERLMEGLERGDDGQASLGRRVDYVLHGHTHIARDARIGGVRIINPGALKRATQHTVATLDVAADVVRHWELD